MTAMAGPRHWREPGDRRVVMAEEDVTLGRDVVDVVAQNMRRRGSRAVELE